VPKRNGQQSPDGPASDRERLPLGAPIWREIDPARHPIIAEANRIAGAAAEILGPMAWAAVILLLVWAEFLAD
jgi:hypothetical protein